MLFVIKKFGFWYRIKINFNYFCKCMSLAEARHGLYVTGDRCRIHAFFVSIRQVMEYRQKS